MVESELVAPPEVLAALRDGRRSGEWIRAYCPFCHDGSHHRRGDRTLAANYVRGFGRNRDRPGWKCHRCNAEKLPQNRRAELLGRARYQYDPSKIRDDEQRRRDYAMSLLEKARPIETDDPVDRYLRGRGLTPLTATWPSSLRRIYLPHPSEKKKPTARRWPVMLAVVSDIHEQPQAVHRTYLTEDGKKAPFDLVKITLGPVNGHAVHLGVDSSHIVIGEGLESTLAAMKACNRVGWSGLSSGAMQNIVVGPSVADVMIAYDRDRPNRKTGKCAGVEAARALRRSILQQATQQRRRIRVELVPPPLGRTDFADF